ncbi:MAG TPA: hypothetical protein PKA90_13785 [Ignavibacteria bacterium]|nr:hypothetical protein [Ignavibacteria bacterium]HMR41490.1 hypothetical protein [Ignavibacteria bacterium]
MNKVNKIILAVAFLLLFLKALFISYEFSSTSVTICPLLNSMEIMETACADHTFHAYNYDSDSVMHASFTDNSVFQNVFKLKFKRIKKNSLYNNTPDRNKVIEPERKSNSAKYSNTFVNKSHLKFLIISKMLC